MKSVPYKKLKNITYNFPILISYLSSTDPKIPAVKHSDSWADQIIQNDGSLALTINTTNPVGFGQRRSSVFEIK
jgi:hypothetical protein